LKGALLSFSHPVHGRTFVSDLSQHKKISAMPAILVALLSLLLNTQAPATFHQNDAKAGKSVDKTTQSGGGNEEYIIFSDVANP
jgi:hypothetical protein